MALGIRMGPGDATGFKLLFALATIYAAMSLAAYSILHMKFVKPLSADAPPHRFSESRAVEHVRALAQLGRQEGRPGLRKAAEYIIAEAEVLKERAGPNVRIEIEESTVDGSFNMMFLGYSISLGYRNHTNIVMRISSAQSQDDDPSVLVNGHFDSPLGSPGAGDCGSCVASMLEVARLIVDSGWNPPRPIIFLFNGAEELFLLGAHGFMKSNKWRDSVGAAINVEASGSGGPDLVCQSGPDAWPSQVYVQSAIYPMAHSAAQDIFPVIPGDTDYRMFSEDYGNIPSLDIIFLFGGYYYHTSYDTPDRLMPGSIQARGDNLFSIIKTFTNSSKLLNARQREAFQANADNLGDERAVFFDYLSLFMVYYPKKVAFVMHSVPIAIFIILPFFRFVDSGLRAMFFKFCDNVKGMLFHAAAILLAIIFPVIFSAVRLLFSSYAMSWFARPYLAFLMFIPSSLIGLLMPRMIWNNFPLNEDISGSKKSKESSQAFFDDSRFWGAFGFYAVFTSVYLVAGLSGGFLTFFIAASMLLAWITFGWSIKLGHCGSIRSMFLYVVPLAPCLIYSVYFGGFLVQFLIEKMGMMGSVPPPFGYFIADMVVAATVGLVTGCCVGPLIPFCGNWLARSSILQFLLHASVLAMALSSQFFPYSDSAPKRVVMQHTFVTSDQRLVDSRYEFSVVDSNSLTFLFKYAPEVAKELHLDSGLSFETAHLSHKEDWTALFPVNNLFSRSLRFPANTGDILTHYRRFPHLSSYNSGTVLTEGSRRVHLEFSLGDLEEVWVAVLNITGPLSSWSFADGIIPAPEKLNGGPPSYVCRLSGPSDGNWKFWLEASNLDGLRVEVAVLDQVLGDEANKLKGLFPNWVDVVAYSSFMSSYIF